jgi:L-ribulose-5-phosphate 3-epimerase
MIGEIAPEAVQFTRSGGVRVEARFQTGDSVKAPIRRGLLSLTVFMVVSIVAGLAWAAETAAYPNVGVFLRCTGKTDPLEALQAVRSIGLNMVQISKLPDHYYTPEGAQEFAELLQKTGIHASSVVVVYDGESYKDLPTIRDTVGFRPKGLLSQRIAYTKKVIDFASALKINIVTFHVGVLPDDETDSLYKQMVDATNDVSEYAGKKGVGISFETGQESADKLLRFIGQVHGTKLGINFDMANLVLYGKDESLSALKTLYPRVTSVHVKDGRLPATPTALGLETRLGEGQGDSKACLEFLKSKHFTGPLVIENYMTRSLHTDAMNELTLSKDLIYKVFNGE